MTRLSQSGGEEWRPVVGWEDRYEVSSQGRVRSLMWHHGRGSGRRDVPLVLQPIPSNQDGHMKVCLRRNGERYDVRVHRLVLWAFVGSCPPAHEAAHTDGNPKNNAVLNLRWATKAENEWDKIGHGTRPLKFTPQDILNIRRRLTYGESQSSIARRFNVHQTSIHKIKTGKAWSHVYET